MEFAATDETKHGGHTYIEYMDYAAQTDSDLVVEAKTGSQIAFRTLVNRYWPKLERYVTRLSPKTSDRDDIVQESFIKMYQNLQSYSGKTQFSTWVYRIAHNTLIDHVRSLRSKATPFFDPDLLFPHPTAPNRPDTDQEAAEIRTLLDGHLADLDTKYREPLVLRYYEGLDYKDIGEILRIPTGTVSIRLRRGLQLLRQRFHSPV